MEIKMNNFFKKGYKRHIIKSVPANNNQENNWNSFSCSVEEVDLVRVENRTIGSLNENIERKKINV